MERNYSWIDYAVPRDAELLDSYSRTITGVVGQVAEAVVHIQVQKPAIEGRGREYEQGRGREYEQGRGRERGQKLMPASGSGFIISTDGFVVTNHHVIEMAQDIKVSLADGRTVNAELKGADPSTDIAVLKIDVTGLKALSFADSDGAGGREGGAACDGGSPSKKGMTKRGRADRFPG